MSQKKFTEILGALDLSEDGIKIVVGEGFADVTQFEGMTFDNFKSMKLSGRDASVLARQFGSSEGQSTGSTPFPTEIKLVQEKLPGQMTALELLGYVINNPSDRESLTLLRGKEPIATAGSRTDEWVIMGDDKKINPEATLAYCTYLGKVGSVPQRMYGYAQRHMRPVSIEFALGIVEEALENPFFADQLIQEGVDHVGNNWSSVDRDLMKAIKWARMTNHQYWPRIVDPLDSFEAITQKKLPMRWQTMLDDFRYAIQLEDPTALNVNLVCRATISKKAVEMATCQGGGSLAGARSTAEQFVRSRSQGDLKSVGMDAKVMGVYENINTIGMDAKFHCVVLGGAEITGMGTKGEIYSPPGVSVKIVGMGAKLQHHPRSWEELAEIVRSF